MFADKRLTEAYEKARVEYIDETSNYVFLSDCHRADGSLSDELARYKNIFFVWASYSPMDEIKTFARNFDLLYHKNIRIGRDPNYIIPAYFRVKYTPFIALYNSKGKIIQTFEYGTEPQTVIDILKQQP